MSTYPQASSTTALADPTALSWQGLPQEFVNKASEDHPSVKLLATASRVSHLFS